MTTMSMVRSHVTLDDPDYVDLYTEAAPRASEASAEVWARTILEETPLARRGARKLWRLMGMRLGPPGSPDHVQGWKIAATDADADDRWIRLDLACWYLTAQAIVLVDDDQVSLSVSLHHDRPLVAKPIWRLIEARHQRAVPAMLRQAVNLRSPAP